MDKILSLFQKENDANPTIRGFYFQFLNTVENWIDIYQNNDTNSLIYCEYEDDIKLENENNVSYKQIKHYATELKFNSKNVKEAIYNFYMNELKSSGNVNLNLEYSFVTNKESTDKIILEWEKYKNESFSSEYNNTVEKIKETILDQAKERYENKIRKVDASKSYTQQQKDSEIADIKNTYQLFVNKVNNTNLVDFCKKISFNYENITTDLLKEIIKSKIEKVKNNLSPKIVLARMIQEVIDKSSENLPENRIVNYSLLSDILRETEEEALSRIKLNIELLTDSYFYEVIFDKIEQEARIGSLNEAIRIIQSLLNSEDSKKLSSDFICELKAKLGGFYLSTGDIGKSEEILNELLLEDLTVNKSKFKFMSSMARTLDKKELLDSAIDGLTNCGESKESILLEQLKFDFDGSNPDLVIEELSTNDQINEEYKDNVDAIFLLARAYLIKGDFEKSYILFQKANSILPRKIFELFIIKNEINPIITKMGAIISLSNYELDFLRAKYNELLNLKESLMQYNDDIKLEFWSSLLSTLLFIDPIKIDSFLSEIPLVFVEHPALQTILADAKSITEEDNLEILKKILSEEPSTEILTKLVHSYFVKSQYSKVVELLNNTDLKLFDSEGRVASCFILSIKYENGIEQSIKKFLDLTNNFPNGIFLFSTIASIYNEKSEIEKVFEYLEKTRDSISEEYFYPRIALSYEAYNLGYLKIAIEIIEPLIKFSLQAKKQYIEYLIRLNETDRFEKLDSIINNSIQSKDIDYQLYEQAGRIKYNQSNFYEAIRFLEKSFELKKTAEVAFNILIIKLRMNNLSNIEVFINYLKNETKPIFSIIIAEIYKKLHNQELSDYFYYKALFNLKNEFNEFIYFNFLISNLVVGPDEEVNLTKIKPNSAVLLKDETTNEEYWIALNSEEEFNFDNEIILGCQNIHWESSKAIDLKGKKEGKTIEFDGKTYKVLRIITRKAKYINYCLEQFKDKAENSSLIRTLEFPDEDPMKFLIPLLEEGKKRNELLKQKYDFDNNSGLPLYCASDMSYQNYFDTVIGILYDPKLAFYGGEPKKLPNEGKIILTLSSIIFLKLFDLLSNLEPVLDRIYIPISLEMLINNLFNYWNDTGENIKGGLSLDDSGIPVFSELTDRQRDNRIEFFRDILKFLKNDKISIISNIPHIQKLNLNQPLSNFIGQVDLDCLNLALNESGYIITEDLYLKKILSDLYKYNKSSNMVGLLFSLDLDIKRILNVQNELSKLNYNNLVSVYNILNIILLINKAKYNSEKKRYLDILSEILHLNFKSKSIFIYAIKNICVVFYYLFLNNREYKFNKKVLNLIVKVVKESSKNHNLEQEVFEYIKTYIMNNMQSYIYIFIDSWKR